MTKREFLDTVFALAPDEANAIMDAFDEYVDSNEPHWIPVAERLPEKWNTAYLATLDYGEYGMAVGHRFFFGDNIGWNDEAVIAWMPLPEPYKGVTE